MPKKILTEDAFHLITEDGHGLMLEDWSQPATSLTRLVRLGRPRPVRITGPMSGATPHRWEDKDPSDTWPYSVDFSGWCALAGETADSLVLSVAPVGLTLGSWTVTPEGLAAIELGDGTAGVDYAVTVRLVTASARTLERTIMIKVRER